MVFFHIHVTSQREALRHTSWWWHLAWRHSLHRAGCYQLLLELDLKVKYEEDKAVTYNLLLMLPQFFPLTPPSILNFGLLHADFTFVRPRGLIGQMLLSWARLCAVYRVPPAITVIPSPRSLPPFDLLICVALCVLLLCVLHTQHLLFVFLQRLYLGALLLCPACCAR